jgi:PIN domain nuclease of toxin-antitoxin system
VILLDTHALIWAAADDRKLGRRSRRLIEKHWAEGDVLVCALSFWEVALLHERGRIALPLPVAQWRDQRLGAGLGELAVDGAIAVRAAGLGSLPDPIDRLIVATALERGAALLTADERILTWKHALVRHDARL